MYDSVDPVSAVDPVLANDLLIQQTQAITAEDSALTDQLTAEMQDADAADAMDADAADAADAADFQDALEDPTALAAAGVTAQAQLLQAQAQMQQMLAQQQTGQISS